MNEELKVALDTLLDVQNSSGLNRKKEFLVDRKNNQTIQDILYFVYNPYIRTGIGWSKLNKVPATLDVNDDWTIQQIFEYLMRNNTGRDWDVKLVRDFIQGQDERFKEILEQIFTKSLKLGVSTTTFNKIWPGLIPGFAIQLACKWQDNINYLKGKHIWITEKLDGNRCLARVNGDTCIFYSRSGREINGMSKVENDLKKLPDGWYDGELVADNFTETQSEIRKKGNTKELVFHIFDMVDTKEVEFQQGTLPYSVRRDRLERLFELFSDVENFKYIKLLPVLHEGIFDYDFVVKLLDEYTTKGSEGLMINTNSTYCFGRTCELLKVKKMNTCDLEIVDIQEGRGEFSGTAGALIVDYKGYRVGVGSGLTQSDRIFYWKNKEALIGRVIEVKFFEETTDQYGNLSLRFPVYVGLRDIDKEVSYN